LRPRTALLGGVLHALRRRAIVPEIGLDVVNWDADTGPVRIAEVILGVAIPVLGGTKEQLEHFGIVVLPPIDGTENVLSLGVLLVGRRVEMWRGGFRSSISVCRPFRLAVP
jgi:hypothetical protein